VLAAVVDEALRLVPPVGGGFRAAAREAEVGGYRVPRGWNVTFSIAGTHSDGEVYVQPGRFRPERWLDAADAPPRCPFGFGGPNQPEPVAFGGGPRSCPGAELARMELKLLLVLFLSEVPTARLDPSQDLTFVRGAGVPAPRDGLRLVVA